MNPGGGAGLENKNIVLDMLNTRYMLDIQLVLPNRELDVQLCCSHERSEIEGHHIDGNQDHGTE